MSEEVRGFIGPDGRFYRWASGVERAELPIDAPEVPALEMPVAVVPVDPDRPGFFAQPKMIRKGFRVYFLDDAGQPVMGRSGFENVTSAKEWFDSKIETRPASEARTATIERVREKRGERTIEHARTYERKRTAWHRVK